MGTNGSLFSGKGGSSLKYDMSAADVDRQIELLKLYPEIADKHYRPALQIVMNTLEREIRPQIPTRTGKAQKAFKSTVLGKGVSIRGEVGWWGATGRKAWYIRFPEAGTKTHDVPSNPMKSAKILKLYGAHPPAFRRSVRAKGISARGFMQHAWERSQSLAERSFAIANEGIVRELALPR